MGVPVETYALAVRSKAPEVRPDFAKASPEIKPRLSLGLGFRV